MEQKIDYKKGAILLIDKPLHWTSFNVVAKLRYTLRNIYKIKKFKVGHAGTLDPLATGLLIICTGKMTKQISTFQDGKKEYTGNIRLGATTPSYDLETEINQEFSLEDITKNDILQAAKSFEGEIDQTPPLFSAKKIDGKRAYEHARKGEEIELKKNRVTIDLFEITKVELPDVKFKIACSKGTYIRSLAHDLGKALNNGGHLTELRRTKSGDFDVKNALSVEEAVLHIQESAVVGEE